MSAATRDPRAEELLSIEQAARLWSVSRDTIERLLRSGDLEFVRIGAHRKVTRSSMLAYVDLHRS
jgi:excisionase family DNA binding protein